MRLVQDYLTAHFQSPLTRLLLGLGNYKRQIGLYGAKCIIQHSRHVSAMVQNSQLCISRSSLEGIHKAGIPEGNYVGMDVRVGINIQIPTCVFCDSLIWVSFIINIAFLVNFMGWSFASRLILRSFVKPVLYILHLCQHEARFIGYGLCPTSRVYSLSRRRDQS